MNKNDRWATVSWAISPEKGGGGLPVQRKGYKREVLLLY